jgi:hypothetical protein
MEEMGRLRIQEVALGYDVIDIIDDVVGNVVPGLCLCYSVVTEGIFGFLYA